jgi:hypothetical protein
MNICKGTGVVGAFVGLILAFGVAGAQTFDRGEVHGFVYDTSHATVANAKVTVFSSSTGYQRQIESDGAGAYAFPQLLTGTYQIKVEAAGFAATNVTDIHVSIGASLALDITLPVKGETQAISVTAETSAVDTTTSGINQVINQRDVENLPLAGRDYRDLAQLSSSAEVVPGLRGGIRMGGQQSDYAGLVIDGQDSFNNFFGEFFGSLETKNFTVPLDSVEEFQVVTNGFAPEFGHATGGLINVVTKSGTNEIHGTAHYNTRPGAMAESDFLGTPPNIDQQQQFGGTVGMPIRKDKQFLFLATDVQREHGPLLTTFCNPGPGEADCQSALAAATGPTFQVDSTPSGSVLPAACKDPVVGGSILQSCYGVANLAQLEGSSNQFQDLFTLLGHYDWQVNQANHFSVRGYGTRNHTSGFTGGRGQNEIQAGFGNTENFINQGVSGVFALNTVLGRKVNEIRVSLQGETRKRHSNEAGTPQIVINDGSVGSGATLTIGQRYFLPINNDNGKLEIQDNFEYTFGKHDLKFGGDYEAFADRKDSFIGWESGEWDFATLSDFANNNPEDLIQGYSLTPGVPFQKAGTLNPAYQSGIAFYVQDKWSVTPRLTLTYGLRWDGTKNPQPQTPFPSNFLVHVGQGSGTTVGNVPQSVPNDFNQFGPRIGLAYNMGPVTHPTVLRAAWGYYYDQSPGIFFPTGGGGKTSDLFCFSGPSCQPAGGFPFLWPNNAPPPIGGLAAPPGINYVDPNFKNPKVSNFTAGVEHDLGHGWSVTGTFTYTHSDHLRTGGYGTEEAWARNFISAGTDPYGRTILQGTYDYAGGVLTSASVTPFDPQQAISQNTTASYAHGNYISGVVNVNKNFTRHFQIFANYIWSRNKDNGASERDTDTYFGQQDPFNLNLDYGRNGLDITHQFKAAGVYELPRGFALSSSIIAHSGVPYPFYINVDVNADAVSDNGHNNDRPLYTNSDGKTGLLGRYPFNQPGYVEQEMRVLKDFNIRDHYHLQLQGDLFNVWNHANKYSNPDISGTVDYSGNCTPYATPGPPAGGTGAVTGPIGYTCTPYTAATLPRPGMTTAAGTYRAINQIAPGSTPFSFQAGVKFIF